MGASASDQFLPLCTSASCNEVEYVETKTIHVRVPRPMSSRGLAIDSWQEMEVAGYDELMGDKINKWAKDDADLLYLAANEVLQGQLPALPAPLGFTDESEVGVLKDRQVSHVFFDNDSNDGFGYERYGFANDVDASELIDVDRTSATADYQVLSASPARQAEIRGQRKTEPARQAEIESSSECISCSSYGNN
mmetsp:Transcript_55361/g.89504  ORF Transcript_55361/g.89504 Transcript_55361/m.89504 type:complete len:193 (+) Transcript_55361:35-613(+)